jgi:uncharacterized protein
MKKYFFLLTLMLMMWASSFAQKKAPYNVVIDITSKDTVVHQMVVNWVKEITTADPNANVEVVFYGKSLDMITRDNSKVAAEVTKYAGSKKVAFKVCQVAMKKNGIETSQLLPGVQTVPDGIYEIISRQHDGWGYIKAGR